MIAELKTELEEAGHMTGYTPAGALWLAVTLRDTTPTPSRPRR